MGQNIGRLVSWDRFGFFDRLVDIQLQRHWFARGSILLVATSTGQSRAVGYVGRVFHAERRFLVQFL